VVTFAIYDSTKDDVVNVEEIKIPAAFDIPESLKYLRNTILDILREYEIVAAGVRATEPSAKKMSLARIQIEGVIQETFASSSLKAFFVGHIATISSKIGIPRSDFKRMIDGEIAPAVAGWAAMTPAKREAILCAKGAANA